MGYDAKGPIKNAEERYIEVYSLKEECMGFNWRFGTFENTRANNMLIFDLYSQRNFTSLSCHSPLQSGNDM